MQLNLIAERQEERLIKQYLEENASEVLAEKINNGVQIEKDGKQLINKKTLSGFMKYACKQAQEQSPKGATSACIDNETVYGWAVHYFEEDSIEETLLNLDGTEYKAAKPKPITPAQTPVKTAPKKPEGPVQFSLFDLAEEETKDEEQETVKEITETETKEIEKPKGSPLYQQYMSFQDKYPDCIVALRVGDFFEIFGENAKKVSEAIDLTLTGRDCGLPERVPMVGYPYHVADIYVAKLVDKGFKVAIVESMDNFQIIPQKVDTDTGEIIGGKTTEQEQFIETLLSLFDYKLEVRL